MAVEIKELIIRAVVEYPQEPNAGNGEATETASHADQEAIVQACVRQVLKILNRSNKR